MGEKHGNQPPGSMEWGVLDRSLPGHQNYRTIQIVYNIHSGIQGSGTPPSWVRGRRSWNIPHKTEIGPSNTSHSYPDSGYLNRVIRELEALGVVEE
ncbi:hypothetical protein NQ314_006159, partial [Rhamnusium bicolor]